MKRIIYWAPRIASIVFILFLALFSLDVFNMKLGFWETIGGLIMHNIPSIVLTVILIISWKYEIVGGIGFIAAGLAYILTVLINANLPSYIMLSWSTVISVPAFLIGILFLLGWSKKHSVNKPHQPV